MRSSFMSDRDLTLTLGQIVEFADEIAALVANQKMVAWFLLDKGWTLRASPGPSCEILRSALGWKS